MHSTTIEEVNLFGYISPDAPYLFKKDETLYNALYCGLCKSIGKGCGQTARTALTYDMAFTSALIHNIKGEDVQIKKQRCVMHWFKRRPMALPDETTIALGCVNTVLTYYKLLDDKRDGEARGILRHLYKSGYKRAIKKHPIIGEIISRFMKEQSALESQNCDSIDMACEPTATMMKEAGRYILGDFSTEHTDNLFYHIGKWVYLIDALDDYDKDVKKGRYNVLYNAYKAPTRAEAVNKGEQELKFIFDMIFAEMHRSVLNIKFYFNHDLTDNIILRGIPVKTRAIFYGECGKNKKSEGISAVAKGGLNGQKES